MAINRNVTFYPRNDTTIDTGANIDIRILSGSQTGTDDITQTITFTHANDNVERMFDPATAGGLAADSGLLNRRGWALRLTEDMTPGDDTNCDAVLTGGTITVSLRVTAAQSGGTYTGGTFGPTFKASLWRYNPSTDAGTLIASGTTTGTTWLLGGLGADIGTTKTASISITVPTTTFSAGGTAAEVLYLQVGLNTNNVPNPLGTANFTVTLTVDNVNTNVGFGSGVNLIQFCSFTNNLNGVGSVTKAPLPITLAAKNLTGIGTTTHTRLSTISKTFNLNGVGTPTYSKVTTAFRTFNMTAAGTIPTSGSNASTITVPIDEIPEDSGGGTTYIFPILD